MRAEDFLSLVWTQKEIPSFKIGTITEDYTSGRPKILFDGETTAGTRTYPYLSSYSPTANDRVLVAVVGQGGVVLGKII